MLMTGTQLREATLRATESLCLQEPGVWSQRQGWVLNQCTPGWDADVLTTKLSACHGK